MAATYDDINKIYQSNFGRPAEKAGADYWMDQATKNPDMNLAEAIRTAGRGRDVSTMNDITNDKVDTNTTWDSRFDPEEAYKTVNYDPNLNKWVKTPKAAQVPSYQPTEYKPQLDRQVDAPTETIEGRITGLLDANNPVIKQAGNRAMQQFAARGLLDSSMAIQAANEAMTAKAIEIAGPDAATYSKQGLTNQTEANKFAQQYEDAKIKSALLTQEYGLKGTLQAQSDAAALERSKVTTSGDSGRVYAEGITQINHDYTGMINNIQQNTEMDQAQKESAIEIQTQLRNQNIEAWNQTAKALSGWTEQWAVLPTTAPAVTTSASVETPAADAITATSTNPYPAGTPLYQAYEDSRPSTGSLSRILN